MEGRVEEEEINKSRIESESPMKVEGGTIYGGATLRSIIW